MSRITDGAARPTLIAMWLVVVLFGGSACEGLEGRNGNRTGNRLFRETQFVDAAAAYERALKHLDDKAKPIVHYNLGLSYSKLYRPGYDKPIRLGEVGEEVCTEIPKTQRIEIAVCIKRADAADQKDHRRYSDCDEVAETEAQLASPRLAASQRPAIEQKLAQLEAEQDAQCDALEQQLSDPSLTDDKRKAMIDEREAPRDLELCPPSFECRKTPICGADSKQLANLAAENLQKWSKAQPSDEVLAEQLAGVKNQLKELQARHEKRMAAIMDEQKATRQAHEQKLTALAADHEKRLAQIREQQKAAQPAHDQKLKEIRAEHEQKLAAVREQQKAAKPAYDDRLTKLKADHEQKLAALKADHEQRLTAIRDKHAKRLAKGTATPATNPMAREAKVKCYQQRLDLAEIRENRRYGIAESAENTRHKDLETPETQKFKAAETEEVQRFHTVEGEQTTRFKESEEKETQRAKEEEEKELTRYTAAQGAELLRKKTEEEPLNKRVDDLTLKDDMRKLMTQAWIDTGQFTEALAYWQGELETRPKSAQIMSTIAGINLKANDWRKSIEWFHKVAEVETDEIQRVGALQNIGNVAWGKLNSKTLTIDESVELADKGIGALQKAAEIQPKNGKLYSLMASIANFRSLTHGASFAAAIDRANAQDILKYARVLLDEAKKQQSGPTPTPTPAPAPATPAPTEPKPTDPKPSDTKPPAPTTPPTSGGTTPKAGG
jgi:hypothetical protein